MQRNLNHPNILVIKVGNWLTICDDIAPYIGEGFDAVICLGNSFSHLLDTYGDQRAHKQAFENFRKCLKPGGLLVIDHRDYEPILKAGDTSETQYHNNVYYNVSMDANFIIFSKNFKFPIVLIHTNNIFQYYKISG